MLETEISLDFVLVEAEFLQVFKPVEGRGPDLVDLPVRDLQVLEGRHPVEDSGGHEIDSTFFY